MSAYTFIQRHHHLTLNVGTVQEDSDFHTQILGLKSVKKTALYDGDKPVYHFYYGNDTNAESTLTTCFPFRQLGRMGRKGTGQIKAIALPVPVSSLQFWAKHLHEHGYAVSEAERIDEKLLKLRHPCGIEYELMGITDDARRPYSNGNIPSEFGIRGTHGITVSIRDAENSESFMHNGWNGHMQRTDAAYIRYEFGMGGSGTVVDFLCEPNVPQGSWEYGEGVVHHCVFQVESLDVQSRVKFHLESLGYTDVSERKDRDSFDSV